MNVKELASNMIGAVREYVARALQPFDERLKAVESRPAPQDGKSITVDDVRPMVDEFLRSLPVPKDGEPGKDGASVTSDDIRGLIEIEVTRWALDFERRAQDVLQRAVERLPKPRDGTDGMAVEDFDLTLDGRDLTVSLKRDGEIVKSITIRVPFPLDVGVFREGTPYEKGDGVTFGGSFWFAQKDAPQGKPGTSPDWRLAVKKGRDGSDAK